MNIEDIDNAYELSAVQRGMLFHVLKSSGTDVYVTYITLTIRGPLDVEMFQLAWQRTFSHHESLRATFLWDGLDEPLRVINSTAVPNWRVEHIDNLPKVDIDRYINDCIAQERNTEFDLAQAPLARFRLIRVGDEDWRLVWVIHHLLADGWSTPLILKDVLARYSRTDPLALNPATATFSHTNYLHWLAGQDLQSALSHWKTHLKDASTTPVKLLQPAGEIASSIKSITVMTQVNRTLGIEVSRKVLTFCNAQRLTLSTLAHGAWALTLGDYADSDRPLFGTTVSGRHPELSGMDEAVGLYLNTLPLSVRIREHDAPLNWLKALQGTLLGNASVDFLSLSELQNLVPRLPDEPLFESLVAIEGHSSDIEFHSTNRTIAVSDVQYATHSNYPLALLVFPGNELKFSLAHDGNRYAELHAEAMLNRFVEYLHGLMDLSQNTLQAVAIVVEKKFFNAQEFTGTTTVQTEFTQIHEWFEQTCDKCPDEPAIIFNHQAISYRQLDRRANQFAQFILDKVAAERSVVGLLLPRGCDQIAAMLGILKSGTSYLPIDPSYPADKIKELVEDSGVSQVVTTLEHIHLLGSSTVQPLLTVDVETYSRERLVGNSRAASTDAYLLYTSGSTGRSKGVTISHTNLLYSTAARLQYYQNAKPRFLLLSSIAFDSSVAGMYWALCAGGTLILPEPGQEKDVYALTTLIQSQTVTHTLCLPTLYLLLLQTAEAQQLNSLKNVIVAGEQCQQAVPKLHFAMLPGCRLFNEYGPTEACVWSSVYELTADDQQPIPIGKPIGTTSLPILSARNRLCPRGVEGELCIGGTGVSEGYHNDPASTAASFIKNPLPMSEYPVLYRTGDLAYWNANGNLVFTGRQDRQLKIRGYRIEPVEIESVLQRFPGITQVAVVARNVGKRPAAQVNKVKTDMPALATSNRAASIEQLIATSKTSDIESILDELEQLSEDQAMSILEKRCK